MQQILKNRALGIIYSFVKNNCSHIIHWYIPCNICFSVPLLFLKLNKKITFYDFGFEPNLIIDEAAKKELKNSGLLLLDHYGKAWDHEKINFLKELTACIIHDCCLSIPILNIHNIAKDNSNLIIYSTGLKKVVEIGYGGIGYYKENYQFNFAQNDLINCENNHCENKYNELEACWNDCKKKNNIFNNKELLHDEWIDIKDNLINKDYLLSVHQKLQEILKHKELLNNIYDEIIPIELRINELSNIWRYNIAVNEREFLLNKLFENKLFASTHYQNCAITLGYKHKFKNSYLIDNFVINLFNDFYYTLNQAEKTANLIKNLFESKKIKSVKLKFIN